MSNYNIIFFMFSQIATQPVLDVETSGGDEGTADEPSVVPENPPFFQDLDSGAEGTEVLDNFEKAATLQGKRQVRRQQKQVNTAEYMQEMMASVRRGNDLLYKILHKEQGPRSALVSYLRDNVEVLSDEEYEIARKELVHYFRTRFTQGKPLYIHNV